MAVSKGTSPNSRAICPLKSPRWSFSGNFGGGWRYSRSYSTAISVWVNSVAMIDKFYKRLMGVQIDCRDWRDIISAYDSDDTLFYLDPPYVPETRKGGKYSHELSSHDHQELVEWLLTLRGKALLSGYPSDVYAPLIEAGWSNKEFEVKCYSKGGTRFTDLGPGSRSGVDDVRTEVVWYNYDI